MKKNKMMRVASALLVAVLMTTSVISGTFAKYVTTDSASDEARVAKWGVELQVMGNLYGSYYEVNSANATADRIAISSTNVAASDGTTDIVAPGTMNDQGFTISLKGQPEVAGKVTTTMIIQNIFLTAGTYGVMVPVADGVITAGNYNEIKAMSDGELYYTEKGTTTPYIPATVDFIADATYYTLEDKVTTAAYYPVVYNLTGNTSNTGANTSDSLKAAADKIATALGLTDVTAAAVGNAMTTTYTGKTDFNANENLADLNCDNLKLTWAWAIGNNADANADTILGLIENETNGKVVKLNGLNYVAVVEYTDYCIDTKFDISITVEQVD